MARIAEKGERFTLLDIGAASGDSARVINELFPGASVTNLDRNPVNLTGAPQPKLIADAFKLPFLERSFDYVLCTLFLHHFPDEDVITLLNSFYSLARKALVVCDLERHILPYCFLPATKALLNWQKITLHDGPISVRASFRAGELSELAKLAGIKSPVVEIHRPAFRISLVGLKGEFQLPG
ncbi:MAG: methyltransferase domain-containing protein [Acidobacteriaceae bacterium]|nr:methyltransferase domain-containing protein [Acidobacteriaceae bacterium]